MKSFYQVALAAATILSISSCHDHSNHITSPETLAPGVEYKKMYRCPMNDDGGKVYEKPGRCPVCGMKLEAVQVAQKADVSYKMLFESSTNPITAGVPGVMFFTPTAQPENKKVELELQHEKKIHLIVVSEDLSYFDHIHPEWRKDGRYFINILGKEQEYTNGEGKNETRLAKGGNYFLFADYKPIGSPHQLEKISLKVTGEQKAQVTFEKEKLSGTSEDFTFRLQSAEGKFYSGSLMNFTGIVSRKGSALDANKLEDYLGAKAHMVIVGLTDKDYIHVHPEVKEGKFDLHTTFKNPGIYRGWVQFQSDGKLHTIDFTIKVEAGKGAVASHDHTDDHSH